MNNKKMISNILLLITSVIWGFSFVAQRAGNEYMGPFTYNALKFFLGGLSLLPLIILINKKKVNQEEVAPANLSIKNSPSVFTPTLKAGIIMGLVLFVAASLQQIGLANIPKFGIIATTAGNAAFITGLYMVFVPFFGIIFLKHKIHYKIWIASFLALVGLFFLCVKEDFTFSSGDVIQIIATLFWAVHILVIDKFSKNLDVIKLSSIQFITCGILSIVFAFLTEIISLISIYQAWIPILYGAFISVGIAYTLQVVAQKNANPAEASIILSMETVFGAIGGVLILNEVIGYKGIIGSVLMLIAMLIPQFGKAKSIKE